MGVAVWLLRLHARKSISIVRHDVVAAVILHAVPEGIIIDIILAIAPRAAETKHRALDAFSSLHINIDRNTQSCYMLYAIAVGADECDLDEA